MSDKSPISPLGDKVVIRPLSDEENNTKSASGIIIPSTIESKDKSDQGVVVAVGPGAWNEDADTRVSMDVKVGDRVLFSSWREKVKVADKEYFVIAQSDIHGIINWAKERRDYCECSSEFAQILKQIPRTSIENY